MKERPILMTGESVRAILDGGKTQTRRVYKPAKGFPYQDGEITPNPNESSTWMEWGPCPYGSPGDRLWVRETWAVHECYDNLPPREIMLEDDDRIFYRVADVQGLSGFYGRWRPSIFMPRWASRINLEVLRVRVERVQDISEEDAIAEGVGHGFQMSGGWPDYRYVQLGVKMLNQDTGRISFSTLWDTLNAKRGHSWESNPWVWVVGFSLQ